MKTFPFIYVIYATIIYMTIVSFLFFLFFYFHIYQPARIPFISQNRLTFSPLFSFFSLTFLPSLLLLLWQMMVLQLHPSVRAVLPPVEGHCLLSSSSVPLQFCSYKYWFTHHDESLEHMAVRWQTSWRDFAGSCRSILIGLALDWL